MNELNDYNTKIGGEMQYRKSIAKSLKTMMTVFKCDVSGESIPDYTTAWGIALSDLSDEEIGKALYRVLREHKTGFMPTPSEFRDYALTENGCANIERHAEIQWYKIESCIQRFGAYQSIWFDDPAIAEWINIQGGWPSLCQTLEDELKWKRREFIAAYQSLKNGGRQMGNYTLGISDCQNRDLIAIGKADLNICFESNYLNETEKNLIKKQIRLSIAAETLPLIAGNPNPILSENIKKLA